MVALVGLTGSALVWITAASSGGCVAANFIQPDVKNMRLTQPSSPLLAGPQIACSSLSFPCMHVSASCFIVG